MEPPSNHLRAVITSATGIDAPISLPSSPMNGQITLRAKVLQGFVCLRHDP